MRETGNKYFLLKVSDNADESTDALMQIIGKLPDIKMVLPVEPIQLPGTSARITVLPSQAETLGEAVAAWKKDRGLNTTRLAEISGMSASTISRLENGLARVISSTKIDGLAGALNIPPSYLINRILPFRRS